MYSICMYYVYYIYICSIHTHRKDRLWIAMEFCGGGSLQDIYHGNYIGPSI